MATRRTLKRLPFLGKRVVVCGGSKGIGKETAKEIVRLGGDVLITARDPIVLEETAKELALLRVSEAQFVETAACDTTDFEALKPHLDGFVKTHGVPETLINMVGYAQPGYVQDLSFDDFKRNMDVNYHGQLAPTLILLPHFIKAKRGQIAFVSSVMGFMGIMGYASYAPTKYALVGLVEVLRHELKPYNIRFSLLYPPDTETPGFEIENQTKPEETAMLSESAKLYQPEKVAEIFVAGLLKEKLNIYIGEGGFFNYMMRHFPGIVRFIIDNDLKKIRKKLRKS